MGTIAQLIAIVIAMYSLGCVTADPWDYADTDAGVYFSLPPGWNFLPASRAEAFANRMTNGQPSRAHFWAVREASRGLNYPDSIVVFSSPESDQSAARFTLDEACDRLGRHRPILGDEEGTARVILGGQQFCTVKPDPSLGLEGSLYVGVGRMGLIFVMAFSPTKPAGTQVEDALAQLRFEP